MVTFEHQGRLGNFLYQAAAAMAYAIRHDLEFSMPSITNDPKHNPIYLQHLINGEFAKFIANPTSVNITIDETKHQYEEIPFKEEWRNYLIITKGYRQSYKYFDFCRKALFRQWGVLRSESEIKRNTVAIHVRRGDFVTLTEKHHVVTPKYLLTGIDYFYSSMDRPITYEWFSDDIEWCKKFVKNSGLLIDRPEDIHRFSEGKSEWDDLIEASKCEHCIISNSTFGTWIAELNQNPDKKVIIPHKDFWFVKGHGGLVIDDIYRPEWIERDL